MKKIISRCPVCRNDLAVTRLKCNSCNTIYCPIRHGFCS
ncbi:DUF2089-like zinc ribbon domain-containing protein [Anaerostipes hominis (ex Lee et al. 2021)]